MIRKKITTDDFVTSRYTHTRFGEKVECQPISTYFKAGLLKDYKNLNTTAEVLFFDGLKTPGDNGQGIYRKVYITADEDLGVFIKVNGSLYKRQYTGAVNLGWFGDDTNAIRTALKYGFIIFERKQYELSYDVYSLTNNVKIDLNGATIVIKDTPLYGFLFRVNDYILNIFNGTIKAHKNITNIARFNNASAITTDFRTNIEFLDLDGNELTEEQKPQTNEILYRGKHVVVGGKKHFQGVNRTLRVKAGITAPTEKNQLVPASYEAPNSQNFDYSNIWKSNIDTTIVGMKTFTNFTYTKESISIFQAPATKSALEYYLQMYKSQIESQLINKFAINSYFSVNAYYVTSLLDEIDVNLLFSYTRFYSIYKTTKFNIYKKISYVPNDDYMLYVLNYNTYNIAGKEYKGCLAISNIPIQQYSNVKYMAINDVLPLPIQSIQNPVFNYKGFLAFGHCFNNADPNYRYKIYLRTYSDDIYTIIPAKRVFWTYIKFYQHIPITRLDGATYYLEVPNGFAYKHHYITLYRFFEHHSDTNHIHKKIVNKHIVIPSLFTKTYDINLIKLDLLDIYNDGNNISLIIRNIKIKFNNKFKEAVVLNTSTSTHNGIPYTTTTYKNSFLPGVVEYAGKTACFNPTNDFSTQILDHINYYNSVYIGTCNMNKHILYTTKANYYWEDFNLDIEFTLDEFASILVAVNIFYTDVNTIFWPFGFINYCRGTAYVIPIDFLINNRYIDII